ncbi:GNAT family N-acetyltransferase [Jannaschia pohangensis]|uniref:Acetyltransferase, GNAT family n=1 Tax=Jannaschia pohangensis TaxID=390807 RepID=A0A1I3S0T3_9RHOB|nr:GNAT family N-acetyltransferase [Jannaschia pohangensis]SFJ51752.1 Acetyltransferase, GNAT family [Jannaschia pohangensis]
MREVRPCRPDDLPQLATIFWRGVHEGAAPRYTPAQRRAWLPAPPAPEAFAKRLSDQTVFVAEEAGTVTGFMTLRADGTLDLAYVLPEVRGSGTADALLAMLENAALARGTTRLTTRASAMAQPFFARHGWQVVAPAPQLRDGVTIPAADMARDLNCPVLTSASEILCAPS